MELFRYRTIIGKEHQDKVLDECLKKKQYVDVDSGGNMSRAADFPEEVHDQSADSRGLCGGTCNLPPTGHRMAGWALF